MIKTTALNRLIKTSGLLALSLSIGLSGKAQNTADNVVNGKTDLTAAATYSLGLPGTTSDVTFAAITYSPATFTVAGGASLNFGTLDDLSTTALTINSGAVAGANTITLNGGTNQTTGANASDLLYVKTGGSLTIGNGTAGSLGLVLATSGNFDSVGSTTINSVISGSGGFTKTGAGTVNLTATNTFTGPVTINAGTVEISSGASLGATPSAYNASQITLNGGTLELNSNPLTIAANQGITLGSSGGTISTSGGGAQYLTINSIITGSGALTLNGSNAGLTRAITLAGANTYTGGTSFTGGNSELGTNSALGTGAATLSGGSVVGIASGTTITNTINIASGSSDTLDLFSSVGTVTVSGPIVLLGSSPSTTINLGDGQSGSTVNITGGITGTGNISFVGGGGGRTTSDVTLSGTNQINNTGTITNSETVNSGISTISSVIGSNVTGVIQNTTVTSLVLSGANLYTSPTQIRAGTLNAKILANNGSASGIGEGAALPSAADLVFGTAGGTLQYNANTAPQITNRLFTIGSSATTTGTEASATLDSSSTTAANSVDFDGTGAIVLGATTSGVTYTLTLTGTNTGNNELDPTLGDGSTGITALVKSGAGKWILGGADTFTGAISITGGTLQIGNGTSGSISSTPTIAVSTGAAVAFDEGTSPQTITNAISGAGGVTQVGGTTIFTTAQAYTGVTTISGGTLQLGNGTTNGSLTSTSSISDNGTLTFDESASIAQSAVVPGIITGTGAVVQEGTGTLTMSGANTFSGGLTIDSAVSVASVGAASAAQPLGEGLITLAGTSSGAGILNYSGNTGTLGNAITVTTGDQGSIVNNGNGLLTLGGAISKNGSVLNLMDGPSGAGAFNVTGHITGSSSGSDLNVINTDVTLSNTNTYNGPTTISGDSADTVSYDVLTTAIAGALPSTSVVNLGSTANEGSGGYNNYLDLDGTAQTIGGLSSVNDSTDTNYVINSTGGPSYGTANGTDAALTIAPAAGTTYTFGGTLGGVAGAGSPNNISVTVSGPGTQIFTGANTYTKGTTIQSGTLVAGSSSSGSTVTYGPFGTGTVTLGNSSSTSTSNPTLLINGAYTVANPITVANATSGTATIGGSNPASTTATYSGPITLNGPAVLMAANGATTDFAPSTAWTTNNNGVTIGSGGNAGTVELDSAIATTGGILVNTGTLALDSAFTGGDMTVASGTTLSGNGSVGGMTSVTSGTVNGSGLTLNGVTTFNGTSNILTGTVTSTSGVALANGAALAENGALTGNLTVGNGALSGTGSVSGTTAVTSGTINGSGLILGGLTTFNGSSNTFSGTETASGGINLAAGAAVVESGTQTGAVNLTAGATSLSGSGSIGAITLNGGGDTLSGASTLTTAGITVNGANNTIASGTVTGATTINSGGALYVNSTAIVSGPVSVSGSLGGTGTTGAVTVAGGGAINLQDGAIGTLTVGSLTTGNAGSPSSLSFDIQTVGGTTSVDKIQDNGTLTLNGAGGTTITIGALGGTGSLVAGNYTLIGYGGTLSGGLANLQLATTSLDGATLTLVQGNGVIELNVNNAGGTTYNLAAGVANGRIMQNVGTTTVTSTITNTGTGAADTLNYSGLGATPASGGVTSGGPLAQGASGSNTQTFTAGATTGNQTITPTVTSATNGTLGGNAALGTLTTATVDVVANRVVTATSVALGRVLVGHAASATSTLSTTGADSNFTRVTVGTAGPDGNGVSATGGTNPTYNSAGVTDTRTVSGTFATAGPVSGSLTLATTGEGLAGEAPISVALGYTADPVNERTFTTSPGTIALGRFLVTSAPVGSTVVSSSGLNLTTANATLGNFTGTTTNGLTLTTVDPTQFNGGSSQMATYSIGGVAGSAGSINGSFSSTPTDEFGNTLANVTVAVTGDAVNQRTITNGAVTDLGTLHTGAAVSATANAFGSTGLNATTTSVLVAGGNGAADSNRVMLTGGSTSFTGATSGLVNGSTQTLGGTITGAGTTTGSFNLAATTLENGGAGLTGEGSYSPVAVAYTAFVYTGQGVWNGNGTSAGSWGTLASGFGTNWGANQGSPGLDPNFTSTDTASFGDISGQTTQTVTLDGANPSLKSITFNGSSTSYTLAQGSGGSIALDGGAGTATVTDLATGGTQTVSAPVSLTTSTVVNVASGQTLAFSGNITGPGGLTNTGTGTLVLAGANTYLGPTNLNAGTLAVNGSTLSSGTVAVAHGATLSGTGTTGAVTVAGGGAINLQDGAIGTLTVGSLTTGNAGNPSSLSFDIQTVGGTTSVDKIQDNGTLTLNGAGGTTITIGALGGTGSLVAGNYTLIGYGGTLSGGLANLQLATTSLDGATLTLVQGNGVIELNVNNAGGTTYNLAAGVANGRIMQNVGTTTVTSTITNTGTGAADTLNYSGLGATPASGGVTSGGPLAQGASGSNTQTFTAGATTGNQTITPTVTSATNGTLGGNAALGTLTTATVDVVANRVVTATSVALGRVLVGHAASATSTLSTTGADSNFTRVTVGTAGPDGNGVSATGGTNPTYNSAGVTDTRTVSGTFATAGPVSGSLTLATTGEGLAGEAPINVALGYTADPVNERTFTTSPGTIALGRFLVTSAPVGSTVVSSSGLNLTTANATLGNFTGTTTNGLTLTTVDPTQFNGGSSQTATYSIGGVAGSVGSINGSFSSTPTDEFGNTLANVTVAVTGDAVNQRTITNGAVTDLGTLHTGAVVSATANAFGSTGLNATTTSVLVAGGNGAADSNGVMLTGSSTSFTGATSGLVNGSTQTLGGTITGAGTTTGSFNLAATTLENGGAGLTGEGSYSPVAVAYTAFVYTGQGVWNGNGTSAGSWGTLASGFGTNWGANQGSPGLDPNFTSTDTASFGDISGQTTQTVTLDGANPSLKSITFNGSSTSYTLAQGSGGSIALDGGAGTATVTDLATGGTQTVSAPVSLTTSTVVNVASGQTLAFSGNITGPGGLTNTGTGTLVLAGANTYLGPTNLNAGTLAVNGSTLSSGTVAVAHGATLTGTGTTGAVTVAGGGAINLQDGAIGTLTVGSLTTGNAGSPSSLSFDIQTVGGTTSVDKIQDNGTLTLNGAGGTTITIGALGGTGSLVAGTYALIGYGGTLSGGLSNLHLATTSLGGTFLTLVQGTGEIDLNVTAATGTTYNLAAGVANGRIMQNVGPTTVTSTITNTGAADTLNYSGLGATPASGGVTSGGPLAQGASGSNTQTFTAGATTGNQTITPTVTSATNGTLGGNAALGTLTTATVDVVANRVVTATSVALGRVLVGHAASATSTLSTTGADSNFTRVTVGTAGPDGNGVSATGGTNPTYNSAGVTDTRTVSGTFATAGPVSGSLTLATTGEGLAGEAPINVALGYTADPVNERTFTTSPGTIALGRFLVTSAPVGSTVVSSSGLNLTTANATLGNFTGTTTNGLTLTTVDPTQFNGGSSQMATYSIGGVAGSAGSINGSFSSTPTDEFGNTLANVTVAVTGDAVNQRTITNGAVTDLGTLHTGAVVSATANAFGSTGLNATTTSVLVAGGNGAADSNGVMLTGSSTSFTGATSGLVNGSTQTLGGTITGAGTTTGSFNLAATTLENGGAGLTGEGSYSPVAVAYTAFVYTGQGVWNGNGTSAGSWGTLASGFGTNWGANQGSPGLDPNFTSTDTASFGDISGQTTQTVTLDGANPSLKSITFNGSSTSYTLAQGSGGSIALDGGAGTATVTDLATGGTQTVSAPVSLTTSTVVNVASGQTLAFSGNITGPGGLTNTGTGTLVLAGANTYLGPTNLNAGTLAVNGSTLSSGTVAVAHGATLTGTGTTGAVTVAGGGAINLQDGAIGTLTVGSLTTGNAGSPSSLSFDIQTVGGTTSVDKIQDNGTLTLNGAGGTTITIGALGGTGSLVAGTYALIGYGGTLSGGLSNLHLATTSLGGTFLTLVQGTGEIDLNVTAATGTTYNLAAGVANGRIMQNVGPTTVTSTITNTGAADTLNYSGLGATPASGGVTSGGPLAQGASGSNTQTFTAGATTGNQTITPTVTSATNGTLGGNAALGTLTTATVDVVANRVVTATSVALGRVLVGHAASATSTLSTTGADSNFTRVTVGTAGPDGNGVSATGGTNPTYNSAGVTDTRTVSGTFATAGPVSGSLTLATTGEGLAGEAPINVALGYTADPVNERTFTTSPGTIALGRFLVTSAPVGSTVVSSSGLNLTTANATLGNFTGTTTNGLTLTTVDPTQFNGGSSQMATYSIGGVAGSAGSINGSFSSTPTDEFGNTLANVTVAVTGDAVNQRTITNGAVTDLGTLHTGAVVSATANAFGSTGLNATTTSVLVAGGNGAADSNGVMLTGSSTSFTGATSGLVNGSTQTLGGTITGAGTTTGSFNLAATTLENGGAGLTGEGSYSPVAVAYTAFVYTGQGVWNTNGSGTWGAVSPSPANWTANGGTPGLDANFTTTDSATFGPVVTAGTAVVTLDGDNPSLNAITFNDATGGSYNIAQGTSGMLKLNAGNGTATITGVHGSNQISAPMELDSNTVVSVQSAGVTLTLSGDISGASTSGLSIGGGNVGTVILSGANTFTGPTTLASGTLKLGSTDALVTAGSVTQSGGTLDLDGNAQTLQNFSSTGGTITNTGGGSAAIVTFNEGGGPVNNASNITGNVGLNKAGGGLLALTGNNDYTGETTITAGTLEVGSNTALGTGSVINAAGTLGTYVNQHVINVLGNYSQAVGGTLSLNLNVDQPTSTSNDILIASGTASLGGALDLHFGFLPAKNDTFVVITAGGGITALGPGFVTPTVVDQPGLLITGSLTDANQQVILTVTQAQLELASALGGFATPNRVSIANALSSPTLAATDPRLSANLVNLVTNASAQQLPQLLANTADDFNPAKFGNFVQATIVNNAVFSTQQLDSYWESQRSPKGDFLAGNGQIDSSGLTLVDPAMDPALAQVSSSLLAWSPSPIGHGLLSDSTDPVIAGVDSNGFKPASESISGRDFSTFIAGNVVMAQNFSQSDIAHSDTSTGGVQLGADFRMTPHLRIGALFGYNHTDGSLDTNNSKATIDTYAPGAYVTFADHGWYANAVGGYGFNNYTEDRHVSLAGMSAVAHGAPSGRQITGDIDGGYDFHVKKLTFGPLAGVQYTHLNVDSYAEDGAEALGSDLNVGGQKADSFRSRVGGHVSYAFQFGKIVLTPHLDVSWQHEFMDQAEGIAAQVGGVPFSVTTSRPSRDSALLDGGFGADLSGQLHLFLDYIVQAGQSNYFGQSIQAGMKFGF